MEATARRKVPGGKLLSVRLKHDGLRVTKAELSGDFFLFPDDSIEVLEASMIGIPLRVEVQELSDIIASVMPSVPMLPGLLMSFPERTRCFRPISFMINI